MKKIFILIFVLLVSVYGDKNYIVIEDYNSEWETNFRDIEGIIRSLAKEKEHPIVSNDDLQKAEKNLFNKIDPSINYRFRKNNITFTFSSPEELERLIEFLTRED